MTSVTGLELSLYERGGYLLRRGGLNPADVRAALSGQCAAGGLVGAPESAFLRLAALPAIAAVVEDLLPGPRRLSAFQWSAEASPKPHTAPVTWSRPPALPGGPGEQAAALVSQGRGLRVAVAADCPASLWVVAGSHAAPLEPEQAAVLAAGQLQRGGATRLCLHPGSLLFYHPGLLLALIESGLPLLVLCFDRAAPGD